MKMIYVEQLPIPTTTAARQAPIIGLVQQILAAPDSPDVPQFEAEIDSLVYGLYGLTEEEIAVVEGKKNNLIDGNYTLPTLADTASVAVKIIDMLGEEVLIVEKV